MMIKIGNLTFMKFFCFKIGMASLLLSSCVQGDLYDYYDDVILDNEIQRKKTTKEPSGAPIYFDDKECVTWALCFLKKGSRDIDNETKDAVVEQILISYGVEITPKMRRQYLQWTQEYIDIYSAGINASRFKPLASSLNLGSYDTITYSLNSGNTIKNLMQSIDNFTMGDVLVRTYQDNLWHLAFLNNTTINNDEITCSDKGSSGYSVNVNNVIGFIVKGN